MKTIFTKVFSISILLGFIFITNVYAQPCSDAGTASSTKDSVCFGDTTTLLLSGYVGAIQWQSYNGTMWINETGIGSTTDNYQVTLVNTTDFRTVVTATGCPPDTSNIITVSVGVSPPNTTGATRCGYGPVTLSSQTPGVIRWYDMPSGGTPLDTGSTFTTNVGSTTTFYAASTVNGGTGVTPMPNQNSTYSPQTRGYLMTSPTNFVITGLHIPGNNGSHQNIAVVKFDNNIPPPFFSNTTNAFTTLFLTQNNPATGVIPVNIPIQTGDVIGVLACRNTGSGTTGINSYANGPYTTVIDGYNIDINRMGMQFPLPTDPPHDIWQIATGSISRLEIYYEVGCESVRTATVATVNPSTPISMSAADSALCAGESTLMNVTSNNLNYTYSWSPPTGLSGTTGSSVTTTPSSPITYYVVANDSICGAIDSLHIDVGPASVAGTALTFQDTICEGNSTDLILQNSVGSVQWQSWDGSMWVNESGTNFDSTTYNVSPLQDVIYRAIVQSGGCDADTTGTIDITVLSITEPILNDTALCGSGNVSLTAIGSGNFNWYDDSTSTSPFFTGPTYAYNATATDTFWVEAFGGADYDIGPINPGIGNQTNGTSNDLGMAFDVIAGCVIESVKVFPQQAGNITVNLRQTQGGPILASYTTPVVAFIGQEIPINFTVSPGTGYRLELAAGSVACTRNTNGASYPYQVTNGPLEITGYYSPNFGTGGAYYWFYDWQVAEGCKSLRVPVVVTVNPFPPTPTIGQLGNTLVSSAPNGNQWILNGSILPGETGQSINLTQIGTYVVAVTVNGCTSLSPPFIVTTISLNEIAGIEFSSFPNPADQYIEINSSAPLFFDAALRIYDVTGKQLFNEKTMRQGESLNLRLDVAGLSPGNYMLEISSDEGSANWRINVSR